MRFYASVCAIAALFSTLSFAVETSKITHFECKTEKELEKKLVSISFSLKGIGTSAPSVVGAEGKQFKISPAIDPLRALNTGDNNDISSSAKGISIDGDEIGMIHTTLFLYADHGYRTGYVQTSGEGTEKLYSPISCRLM